MKSRKTVIYGRTKQFVIGRKNWLFAKASATIYSVIETAKLNGLNTFEYLKYVFEEMKEMDLNNIAKNPEQIDRLLPWSQTLPEVCRLSGKANTPETNHSSESKVSAVV